MSNRFIACVLKRYGDAFHSPTEISLRLKVLLKQYKSLLEKRKSLKHERDMTFLVRLSDLLSNGTLKDQNLEDQDHDQDQDYDETKHTRVVDSSS